MKKKILKPRKTGEQRRRNHRVSVEKRIKKYIKDGSKGNLDLCGSPVEKLPDNLQVGDSLFLNNTPIKELPDNLQVGGFLSLINTPIKELPDNLKVGDSLDLRNTPLSKKYSEEEIRNMIKEKGGYVKEFILT